VFGGGIAHCVNLGIVVVSYVNVSIFSLLVISEYPGMHTNSRTLFLVSIVVLCLICTFGFFVLKCVITPLVT
jgi:hypothetical protein